MTRATVHTGHWGMKRDDRISSAGQVHTSWPVLVRQATRPPRDPGTIKATVSRHGIPIPHPPRDTETVTVNVRGVGADRVITPLSRPNRHALYLHGGADRLGAPSTYRHFTWRIASAAQAQVLAIDYRLAPENPFPAALEDAISYDCWLLTEGADPRQIVVIGDLAGGGLALALLLRLRDSGLPLPAAAVVLCPGPISP